MLRLGAAPAYERGLPRLRRRDQNLLGVGILVRMPNRLGQLDKRRAGTYSFGYSLCDLTEYEFRLVVEIGESPDEYVHRLDEPSAATDCLAYKQLFN